jgi:hypothetical protein
MQTQIDADADDDAAAAADLQPRWGSGSSSSTVSRGTRVRFSYAALRADGSSGNTPGLHPGIPGSNPGRSTKSAMLKPLSIRNQLWRLCMNFASTGRALVALLVSKTDGQSSILWRPAITAGGRVVKAPVCKTGFRGFESRPAVQNHDVVVSPT